MKFNEDEYQNNILNKYLDEQDYDVSNCCGATIEDENNDICPDCGEHCLVVSIGDYNYQEQKSAWEEAKRRDER